jgi:hypothetical protein
MLLLYAQIWPLCESEQCTTRRPDPLQAGIFLNYCTANLPDRKQNHIIYCFRLTSLLRIFRFICTLIRIYYLLIQYTDFHI